MTQAEAAKKIAEAEVDAQSAISARWFSNWRSSSICGVNEASRIRLDSAPPFARLNGQWPTVESAGSGLLLQLPKQ